MTFVISLSFAFPYHSAQQSKEKIMRRTQGNGRSPSLDAQLKKLRIKIKSANKMAAREIEDNVRKFGFIAEAAERDLKRLRGLGKGTLRAFRSELKRSWKDLKRVAQQQF
jgi:hypothetical protein